MAEVDIFFANPGDRTRNNMDGSKMAAGAAPVRIAGRPAPAFGNMTGRSTAMREVFALLERAAASDVTVMLTGETGTGKEVAARSIHDQSARRDKPFVVVDCGAIPPHLIESELFGHLRGSFTGAATNREGLFAAASGGTLFLDEIGELGPELQPKLLRALERREIKPVGASKYVPVDVRVIAATHRDLGAQVDAGQFRSDLYYRLAVLEIQLPSLRERREDLLPLVERFLEELGATAANGAPMRSEQFRDKLARHSWPGNVRELRNYVERCLALNAQPPISQRSPKDATGASTEVLQPLKAAREAFDRRYLEALLRRHGRNMSAAARAAGIDRANLYRMAWRHGLTGHSRAGDGDYVPPMVQMRDAASS